MKRITILLAGILITLAGAAQTDSTSNTTDTIRVGGMIIVKKRGDNNDRDIRIERRHNYRPSKVSTNWWIVDIGFTNYTDKSDYTAAHLSGFAAPDVNKDEFTLRTNKSINVNIWVFMQRLSLIKNVVNLKYGLGVELNNYRYKQPLRFEASPTHVFLDKSTEYSKNKLAADYLTAPIMLNFNFTPERKNGFGFSAGVSGGYLYSSRQKTITAEDGKKKTHDDFDLKRWKVSYIGEVQLGPVKLYGSLASQTMWDKALDQTPYSIGIRLSNW